MPVIAIVGAGPGLGIQIAHAFGRKGFAVAMVARNAAKLDALVAELHDKGIDAAGFVGDINKPDTITEAFAAIKQRYGKVDVLEYSPADPTLHAVGVLDVDPGTLQPQIDFYIGGPSTFTTNSSPTTSTSHTSPSAPGSAPATPAPHPTSSPPATPSSTKPALNQNCTTSRSTNSPTHARRTSVAGWPAHANQPHQVCTTNGGSTDQGSRLTPANHRPPQQPRSAVNLFGVDAHVVTPPGDRAVTAAAVP